MNELAQEFGVHPSQVGQWKKLLQEQASDIFDSVRGPKPTGPSTTPERLYSEIGRLKMELDWIKKSQGSAYRGPEAVGRPKEPIGADQTMRTGRRHPFHCLCAASGCRTGRAGIDPAEGDRR